MYANIFRIDCGWDLVYGCMIRVVEWSVDLCIIIGCATLIVEWIVGGSEWGWGVEFEVIFVQNSFGSKAKKHLCLLK